jgi:poly-beta-1,6-N-acetyl-D-glucosamine N-deacetylase
MTRSIFRIVVRVLANSGVRVLGVFLLVIALAIPAFAYWHASRPRFYGLAEQIVVPLPRERESVPSIPNYRQGVVVLCYHDLLTQSHNRYTVPPTAFAAQMAALKQTGFHTISAAKFVAFVRGEKVLLPSRPLLITFDDGAKGTWIYADQILRRLSYQATVFLITGDVSHHQPYYLDWAEVEAMARTGRWSFGSHTFEGHGLIASNNSGSVGPYLTNRMWLPHENRLETMGEYRARAAHDLDHSISQIEEHGLPRPLVFAYPFSASSTPTNDPAIGPILARMLASRFSALMNNTTNATRIQPGMRGPLPRVEVFHGMGARKLLGRVRDAIAHSPRSAGARQTITHRRRRAAKGRK